MGLVTRVVEAAGIPTVLVSTARDLSLQVKPPRTVFVNHPMGNTFGKHDDTELQRQILCDALDLLVNCKQGGELVDLPYQWPKPFAFKPGSRGQTRPTI